MNSQNPVSPSTHPNVAQLQSSGWSVNAVSGNYCVAWRGQDEVVMVWQQGGWRLVNSWLHGRQVG